MARRPASNQDRVLAELAAVPGHAVSAYGLLERLSAEGLRAPSTIYRALEQLVRAGAVHRVESLNAYVACSHGVGSGAAPHGHARPHRPALAVCRTCSAVQEIDDGALAAVLGTVADATGYQVEDRIIELAGRCGRCATSAATPPSPLPT